MIAVASDHGGFDLKQEVMAFLEEKGYEYKDFGCYDKKSVDYPDYARTVADKVLSKEAEFGILICGTGIGISIAANRIPGIRAALCSECFSAQATREHNNANILALGGRTVGPEVAKKIVETFLETPFSQDERHQRRIDGIEGKASGQQ
ncbi:ribose 5-phosphate isomerase B [Anaerotalea alkaliphila]|uniref:Ribose 5-phosphate isomerase B n=1 Tax=Anaerotalea alkaliphila TaxID=2662126 RepID=A0A7X5HU57_9FIRM|nr:ribose 5-phosphate isomerase B [Anaerotalea alkaliphila]NDL66705.1 ribose 5-phosphate isomerase B [Anaerotalea alkaliphila]